jgi:hypothetical protein
MAAALAGVAGAVTTGAVTVTSGARAGAGGTRACRHRRSPRCGRSSPAVSRSSPIRCAVRAGRAALPGGISAAQEERSMRKQRRFSVGMACVATLVLGMQWTTAVTVANASGVDDESARTEAAVMAVDQHWMNAELDGDSAWLDAMLLPEYRSVGADGTVHTKAALLAHAAKNRGNDAERRKVEAWLKAHPSRQTVVIRGDTAILTFYDPKLGARDGVRASDVFVYENGRWHALYSQHSKAGG